MDLGIVTKVVVCAPGTGEPKEGDPLQVFIICIHCEASEATRERIASTIVAALRPGVGSREGVREGGQEWTLGFKACRPQ